MLGARPDGRDERRQEGSRRALVIATSSYADPTLSQLRAPGQDASALAEVLESHAIGGFAVDTVLDAPADTIRRRVARFCAQGEPRDLALVYLSCHGVLDDRGRLYYATADTDRELLAVTAVPAAWVNDQLEDCRCRRQLVILDCCHSGAFAAGAKGEGALALRTRFEGHGRVVLTASRATEYSFEGDRVVGEGASSVFTEALVTGLRTGGADTDGDGLVTVNELYDYAYQAVKERGARQTPSLWSFGAEGSLLVARSPQGPAIRPVPLPQDLGVALESPRPTVREGAVAGLSDLLTGPDPGRALTARRHLERVAAEDLPRVAGAAKRILDAHPEPASSAEAPSTAPPTSTVPVGHTPARSSGGTGRVAGVIARHRGRSALVAVSLLLLVAGVAAVVVSGGRGGGGSTEYAYGASITLTPLEGVSERARAHYEQELAYSDAARQLELTEVKLARGSA